MVGWETFLGNVDYQDYFLHCSLFWKWNKQGPLKYFPTLPLPLKL